MALTRWDEIFDGSGIQGTIRDINTLDSTVNKALKNITTQSSRTSKQLNSTVGGIQSIRKELDGLGNDAKSSERIKELAQQFDGLRERQVALIETQKGQKTTADALKGSTKQLKQEAKALQDQYDRLVTSQNKNSKEAKLLAENIRRTRSAAQDLTRNTRAMNNEFKAADGSYNGLIKRNKEIAEKLKNTDLAIIKQSKSLSALRREYLANTTRLKQFDETLGQSFRNVGNYSSALQGAGRNALSFVGALGVATSAVFLLAQATRFAFTQMVDFDEEMVNLAAISGQTRDEIKDVEEVIREVGQSSLNTAVDIAKTAISLKTLGKSNEEIKLLLQPVDSLAIALKTTAEEAGELLVQTLNTFGESSEAGQKYADIIAKIRTSTALDFTRIKDSLGFVAPAAKALNITLPETGALLGVLIDNGIKAARAGRLLSSSLARLNSRGLTLDDALEKISVSSDKTKTSTELFGTEAFTLGLILADNTTKIDKYTEAFNSADGELRSLTEAQKESVRAGFKQLVSAITEFILLIDNGNGPFSTAIKGITGAFTDFFTAITNSDDGLRKMVAYLSGPAGVALFDFLRTTGLINTAQQTLGEKYRDVTIRLNQAKEEAAQMSELTEEQAALINGLIAEQQALIDQFPQYVSQAKKKIGVDEQNNDNIEEEVGLLNNLNRKLQELQSLRKSATTIAEFQNLTDEINSTQDAINLLTIGMEGFIETLDSIKAKNPFKDIEDKAKEFRKSAKEIFGIDLETGKDPNVERAKKVGEAIKEIEKDKNEAQKKATNEREDFERTVRQESFNFANSLNEQLFINNSIRRDNELVELERNAAQEIALAGDNARRKQEIENRLEQQRRKIQTEQAKADKRNRIFNILTQAAENAVRLFATTIPPGILSKVAIGQGLVQAGFVAAQPLPAFEKGRKSGPETIALVGEKGPELEVSPGGKKRVLGAQGPEITTTMPGSRIYTHKETEKMMPSLSEMIQNVDNRSYTHQYSEMVEGVNEALSRPTINTTVDMKSLENKIDELKATIKNKPTTIINTDGHRQWVSVEKQHQKTNYLQEQLGIVIR